MKRTIIFTILLLSFIASANAWALFDVSAEFGYTFYGTVEIIDDKYDHVKGFHYGFFGHININAELFLIGLGFAWIQGDFNYSMDGETQTFNIVSSFGPDIMCMLKVSSTTRPFARIGFSLFDKLKYDYGEEYKDKIRFLNSGWISIGVGQLLGEYFVVFVECQRHVTHLNQDHELRRYVANVGIMFAF